MRCCPLKSEKERGRSCFSSSASRCQGYLFPQVKLFAHRSFLLDAPDAALRKIYRNAVDACLDVIAISDGEYHFANFVILLPGFGAETVFIIPVLLCPSIVIIQNMMALRVALFVITLEPELSVRIP